MSNEIQPQDPHPLADDPAARNQTLARRGVELKSPFDWRIVAPLLIAGLAFAIWRGATGHAKAGLMPNPKIPVAVARVTREDLVRDLVCDAELRPYQEVDLHSKVGGFLEKITVDIGDKVEAGQLLATIEIPELGDDIHRARAALKRSDEEVARAQATAEDAHLVYTRLSSVDKAQPNLIAQQELDTALEKERSSASSLAAARAEVDVAKAELSKLETMAKYSQITAPFAGVITKRYADPGALIQAGTSGQSLPLVRLSQNDRLRLNIPVSVSHVASINNGDPVEVRVDSLDKPFAGKIARSARKVETATRTMEVEVDVLNSDLKLIPGMYASVLLRLEHRERALCVPVEAISRQKSCSVLLVDKDHKVENRQVSLGLETPDKIEVLEGLRENDLVVVGNRAEFKPGQQVEPKLMETAKALE